MSEFPEDNRDQAQGEPRRRPNQGRGATYAAGRSGSRAGSPDAGSAGAGSAGAGARGGGSPGGGPPGGGPPGGGPRWRAPRRRVPRRRIPGPEPSLQALPLDAAWCRRATAWRDRRRAAGPRGAALAPAAASSPTSRRRRRWFARSGRTGQTTAERLAPDPGARALEPAAPASAAAAQVLRGGVRCLGPVLSGFVLPERVDALELVARR